MHELPGGSTSESHGSQKFKCSSGSVQHDAQDVPVIGHKRPAAYISRLHVSVVFWNKQSSSACELRTPPEAQLGVSDPETRSRMRHIFVKSDCRSCQTVLQHVMEKIGALLCPLHICTLPHDSSTCYSRDRDWHTCFPEPRKASFSRRAAALSPLVDTLSSGSSSAFSSAT